ncbi:hypothetical protein PHISCL_05420 [Aspergillus sclerotialis]|uniref:Uncharacterized protein n=1 Tax=Aspergillus sclerotialis TaxID=2070753 RepID=A0A3A2ZYW0_9EURO|nr:hypothetical protein PHISCL_05420 [Aspergillus sclerotialis]
MIWSTKAVYTAVAVYSLINPLALSFSPLGETIDDSLVLLQRHNESAFATKFRISCPQCEPGYGDSLLFELSVHAASSNCDREGVSLNGQELIHTWNGDVGNGSGSITSLSKDVHGMELSANWQSLCILPSPNSPERHGVVQLLSVQINSASDSFVGNDVGFTASFTRFRSPEILRLYTSPVNVSGDDLSMDSWRDPEEAEPLENKTNTQDNNKVKSLDDIEWRLTELENLKAKADRLQQQIKKEQNAIRKLLQQDCLNLRSKWKECKNMRCKLEASLQKVPDLFRQIRYRFGTLPPSLQKLTCTGCQKHDICNLSHSQHPGQNQFHQSPQSSSQAAVSDSKSSSLSSLLPDNISRHIGTIPSLKLRSDDQMKHLFRTTAIILLVCALATFIFKICRNITCCRRRRAERAARREERRARRAYRSAARRLRWRQWWEGTSYRPTQITPDHDLEEFDPEQSQQANSESSGFDDQGTMQTEIQRLRRVFEYVGGLVLNEDCDPEESLIPLTYGQHEVAELPANGNYAPSSTAALTTTVNSPRSSSLMTFDTPSSITLDTLEGAETDPPSYYQ